ncbi:MAG TPA: hypothetical protein PLJ47_15105 [Candidatus Hydrogenedentes bacterium]|nr:hypothetical protein [Candidatus Hydrogenedentota bacterium]
MSDAGMTFETISRETPLTDAVPEPMLRAWIVERNSLPLRNVPGMELSRWADYHIDEIATLHKNANCSTYFAPSIPCLMITRFLSWDTEILGISCMSIEHLLFSKDCDLLSVQRFIDTICNQWRDAGHTLAVHKTSPANLGVIAAMGHTGFEMLSIHLDYLADAPKVGACFTPLEGFEFGPARPDEQEGVAKLTSTNYALMDRFSIDPLVPRDAVPKLYWEWGMNAFRGYSELVWIARHEGEVVGITFWTHRKKLERITGVNCELNQLGAVDSRFWNKGLFRRMTASVLGHLAEGGARYGSIATNILNHSLQRSVQNLGCTINDSVITFRKDLRV